jgi:glucoamylase
MKLATVLHSLGLTGPVLDFSKSVIIVDTYVEKETPIAKSRLLANIGPDGIKSHGALVWSSSTHPRRIHLIPCCALSTGGLSDHQPKHSESQLSVFSDPDSALVFKLLIEDFVSGDDPTLRGLIDAYVSVEANDPADPNPSGPAGQGELGEPKFTINGTAFSDPWGVRTPPSAISSQIQAEPRINRRWTRAAQLP